MAVAQRLAIFVCDRAGHVTEHAAFERYVWCPACGARGLSFVLTFG